MSLGQQTMNGNTAESTTVTLTQVGSDNFDQVGVVGISKTAKQMPPLLACQFLVCEIFQSRIGEAIGLAAGQNGFDALININL